MTPKKTEVFSDLAKRIYKSPRVVNLRKSSKTDFAKSTLLYAGIIFAAIEYRTLFRPVIPVEVYTDKFITSANTTDKQGVYINDYRIPIELLAPGIELQLPYGLIKNPDGNLKVLVDDASLEVELHSLGGKTWNLESKVEPAGKDMEGKDGLTLSGRIADSYKVVIKTPGNTYNIIVTK